MVLDGDIYVKAKGEKAFKVQPKTRVAQEALWRILYDNDFHPEGHVQRPQCSQSSLWGGSPDEAVTSV